MKHVKFRPWKGDNYEQIPHGKKLLILGDSHYCAKDKNRNDACRSKGDCSYDCMNDCCYKMTHNLIRDEYIEFRSGRKKSEGYLQTILTFEKNLFGYTPSPQESINFWNSVIFYNYIQHSQYKPRSRRKTEAEEIDDYKEAFKEVLAEYQPDCIIIWSKFLFTRDWLPDGAPESPDYTLKAEYNGVIYDTPVRTFKLDAGNPIPAIIIQHPCCRFGKDQVKWHILLKAFLELED
jgi:hypothetical protein